jgi:hypothetical protein
MNKKISVKELKTIFSVVLVVIVLISLAGGVFNSPPEKAGKLTPPQYNVPDNEFMVGVMDVGPDKNYQHILELNMNAWHKYTAAVPRDYQWVEGWPDISNDRYDEPTENYAAAVTNRIANNRTRGMRSIMDRPKTGYLASGQRSIYQCEPESFLAVEHQDYSFYTYSEHPTGNPEEDITTFGNGAIVMRCRYNIDQPGYVVKDLKANHEQANDGYGFMKGDKECKWYVMPRIRIPQGTPDNTPVCSLEVRNWHDSVIKQQVIYAINFKDENYYYDGKYLVEFYWEHPSSDPPSGIEIRVGQLCPPPSKDFTNWNTSNIQTDFRVHWYGFCDMWIDYVLVENEPAHKLFFTEKQYWENQIRAEVALALHGSTNAGYVPNVFYLEEMEFNCIPCIGYVNRIIQDEALQHGVEMSLMTNINYNLFKVHVPTCWSGYDMTSEQLKKFIVDSGYVKRIVLTEYPLTAYAEGDIPYP